jgi:hypothetical protein
LIEGSDQSTAVRRQQARYESQIRPSAAVISGSPYTCPGTAIGPISLYPHIPLIFVLFHIRSYLA